MSEQSILDRLARLEERLKALKEDVSSVKTDLSDLRKTLIVFALSIAGSAVVFGLTILAATKRI